MKMTDSKGLRTEEKEEIPKANVNSLYEWKENGHSKNKNNCKRNEKKRNATTKKRRGEEKRWKRQ